MSAKVTLVVGRDPGTVRTVRAKVAIWLAMPADMNDQGLLVGCGELALPAAQAQLAVLMGSQVHFESRGVAGCVGTMRALVGPFASVPPQVLL